MAAPGQGQLKFLPQLLFRNVLVPILESVQMGDEHLEYSKPRGMSGNFEHKIKLDGTWQVVLQGKEVEIPSNLRCMSIKMKTHFVYEASKEWDL
eukprot:2614864-Karenia_brevis.AAC.1